MDWKKVKKGPPGDCWEWLGRKRFGYGITKRGGRYTMAHRVSYEENIGLIPEGLHVCHHCDNPGCVNPDHLFVGTAADNIGDAARKGRMARGRKNGANKLTAEEVLAIRADHASGANKTEIGRKYGITRQCVHQIVRRMTWAWLTGSRTA